MKHQITLLGGQIIPIFWGIKEKNPQIVHILYSKESRHHISILKNIFTNLKIFTYQISPYDFKEIKEVVEQIIFDYSEDIFELNLTGGTKVMALACQNIFNTLEFDMFYVNQNNKIYDFVNQTYIDIKSNIKIDKFIELSGHKKQTSKKLSDYSDLEIKLANQIDDFSSSKHFKNLIYEIHRKIIDIQNCKKFNFSNDNMIFLWDSPYFKLSYGDNNISLKSSNAFNIAFNGLWWELVVAETTIMWKKSIEQQISLELFLRSKKEQVKNEIDVVLNTGKNMIFIECKSGNVSQNDIHKIRAVKRLYGGVSTKSILVCKYKPRPDIIEKCQDLGIDIFFDRDIKKLPNRLDQLLTKDQL